MVHEEYGDQLTEDIELSCSSVDFDADMELQYPTDSEEEYANLEKYASVDEDIGERDGEGGQRQGLTLYPQFALS